MSARKWWRIIDAEGASQDVSTPATKRPEDCGYGDKALFPTIIPLSGEPGEFGDVDEATGKVTRNADRAAATKRRAEICSLDRADLVDRIEEMVAEAVAAAIADLFPDVQITPAKRAAIRARAKLRTGN